MENLSMFPKIITGLAVSTISFIVHAQFVVLDPTIQVPLSATGSAGPAVVTTGTPVARPATQMPISDSIRASSLSDTLRTIIPPGWNAFAGRNLNANTPVDYIPHSDWRESLRSLSDRYNLIFKVDNDARKVFVDPGPGGMRDMRADTRNIQTGPTLIGERPMVHQLPDGNLRFEVKEKQRLSDAMRTFLAAGNWRLVWKAGSDVVPTVGFVSTGSDIKTIMDDVLSNFGMHATIHRGNNTVVIHSNTSAND